MTNEEWIHALSSAGAGQQAALGELRALLLRGLGQALADRQIPSVVFEDAAQEALIKIVDQLDSFRGRSRFTTWAMTIAVRAVWTEMRRRHWQGVSLDEVLTAQDADGHLAAAGRPGRDAERSVLADRLRRAIDRDLTSRQRTALLAELAGMPQAEIARRMGSNRNAMYKLVHDARKRLRASLESIGYSGADVSSAYD